MKKTHQVQKTETPKCLKSGTCPSAEEEPNLMALTGAAVSVVIGELLNRVLKIKGKMKEYNYVLERIETILKQIEPIVKEIDDLKGKPDPEGRQTEQLWGEIQRGKDLIRCCKNEICGWCSCLKKPQYQYLGRLQELDKSLSLFYSIVVSLHNLRVSIQTRDSVLDLHRKVDELGKILAKNKSNDSAVDASNNSQGQGSSQARPSGHVSGDETCSASSSAPTRVPESSVSPVPHHRKQVLGEYEWADSKGKDAAATPAFPTKATGLTTAAPEECTPPSLVSQTSGFGQVKPKLEEDRHQDPTKTATLMAHNVPPSHPSSPHKSPEVVQGTRCDGPAQILPPYQAMDPPRKHPHVQPEPSKFKQVPDKVTEVPNEPAYTTVISPLALNDSTRGASFGKDSPSGRHSSYPVKPVGPATANYGFGVHPKSPETKSISPAQDRYQSLAPTTAAAANPAPHRPYIPPDSQKMITTNFAKDPSSRGDSLTPSYIPHSSQPRTKEVDHDQGNLVPDKWKSGQSNPEIKKVCGEEWRRNKSRDQKEYSNSDENEE